MRTRKGRRDIALLTEKRDYRKEEEIARGELVNGDRFVSAVLGEYGCVRWTLECWKGGTVNCLAINYSITYFFIIIIIIISFLGHVNKIKLFWENFNSLDGLIEI